MASLREQLLGVRDKYGFLTPPVVVDEARPEDSPLHSRFEWDDTVAGEAYRVEQARRLIQSVRVRYMTARDEPADVRAFVAVPRSDSPQPIYEPVETAMADPITRALVLASMEREWKNLRARYGHLAEFADTVASFLAEHTAA